MEPVPAPEILKRQAQLQQSLSQAGISLALIRQAADLYYYTGVIVDGFLALGAAGTAILLIRKPQHRLQEQDLPFPVAFIRDVKEVPGCLAKFGLAPQGPIGLEQDVMPAALYLRLQKKIFPGQSLVDISGMIRKQRMVKSPYELAQIRRAAHILDDSMEFAATRIRAGLTELELAATLEYHLRLAGHQGLVRTRTWNLEMFFGHVLSGAAGMQAAYVDTPSGGTGFSHGFPQGAGAKALAPHEPISVDLAACVNGYVADQTRMYVMGDLPPNAWQALELVEELFTLYEAAARPGVMVTEIYEHLLARVNAAGRREQFMGWGNDRVAYVGHGVGLELDEFPIIGARFPYPLEADMVIAFEPKFFLPDIGMVGLEDTGRITPAGVEWLSRSPRRVYRLNA